MCYSKNVVTTRSCLSSKLKQNFSYACIDYIKTRMSYNQNHVRLNFIQVCYEVYIVQTTQRSSLP